jgi:Lin1244/Lin1753-like, N-terminal
MARPTKQGIDYFPLDTVFDDDMNLLFADVGAEGLGIVITIWQMIYSGNGYYVENDNMFPLKVKMRCFAAAETIVSVVEKAVSYGIFDVDAARNHNILTSKGIQKRYFTASKKKKTIEINRDFLLIPVDSSNNLVFVDGNQVIAGKNVTKGKEEVKGKEDKEKKYGTFKNVSLTQKEKQTLDEKFDSSVDGKINALSEYMESKGKSYKSHYATILAWARKDDNQNAVQVTTGFGGTNKRLQ